MKVVDLALLRCSELEGPGNKLNFLKTLLIEHSDVDPKWQMRILKATVSIANEHELPIWDFNRHFTEMLNIIERELEAIRQASRCLKEINKDSRLKEILDLVAEYEHHSASKEFKDRLDRITRRLITHESHQLYCSDMGFLASIKSALGLLAN
jgi:hypothetical protein